MREGPAGSRVTNPIDQIAARLERLHPRLIDLSLDRLRVLLARLDHPERRLPPIIHVAGTNGKGSTCAFIRAMAEAAGLRVHVYTSPHLIHFNERIRIAGKIVEDGRLLAAMERIERINDDAPITVFEVITATAFDLFAQTQADLCVLEVGLGGRGDATNVVDRPAACAITSISLDHRDLLGPNVEIIAGEKAGIMKPGIPVAIGAQAPEVRRVLLDHAKAQKTPVRLRGDDWEVTPTAKGFHYSDMSGSLDAPSPSLPGLYQIDNAGIAITALRATTIPSDTAGLRHADWPARLQQLHGRLAQLIPAGWELWLDGGHNPGAGIVLAEHLRDWSDRPVHLIVGMKLAKDSAEFLRPMLPLAATTWAVQEPNQHAALPVEAIIVASGGVARAGPRVEDALRHIPRADGPARILICGSLYLAGEVLKLDQ
jgi:dihydrofolate synthase / folylpolyglutamate synthase